MPFFQPAFLPTEASIFQHLLSELEQSEQPKTCGPRRHARCQPQETFTPRFDVTETPSSYELFGEVAGLEQEALSIEFSDAQTLVIKGKTQRPSASSTQQAPAAATPAQPEAAAQEPESDASSEKSHNPTVEDEYDAADTPLATPATTNAVVAESQPEKQQQQEAQAPKPRYWVSERRVGSFARSFSFSQRIEQDEVTASLKNGILHVVVPKSVKSRKIAVNVN